MTDRRSQRTLTAIRQAFLRLLTIHRFEEISVGDIGAAAGIGKSTYYEHFRSKEDLLSKMMEGMLRSLARTACGAIPATEIEGLLQHFWDNRRLGRVVFAPPMAQQVGRQLAQEILAGIRDSGGDAESSGARLFAIGRAHGQIAMLQGWMTGEVPASVAEVAERLCGAPLSQPSEI